MMLGGYLTHLGDYEKKTKKHTNQNENIFTELCSAVFVDVKFQKTEFLRIGLESKN